MQRWVKFAKHLPSFGWQPVIYTPQNPEMPATDHSLEAEIPDIAEVLKTHISEPYSIYHKLAGKKAEGKGAGLNPINFQRKSLKQRLALWIRSNFFVPDPRRSWVQPSVRYLRKYLKSHPVDAIITTGPPHSMHLIGLGLRKKLNTPWVADFRDPWTKMFYFKHLGLGKSALKKHLALEQAVLDGADAVISVSPLVKEDFEAATTTPVHLITNGYDEDDFAAVLPRRAMSIRDAFFAKKTVLPVSQCEGRIAGDVCVSCPPAVSPVVCGEVIDGATAEYLRSHGVKSVSVIT